MRRKENDKSVLFSLIREILNISKSEVISEIAEEIDKHYLIISKDKDILEDVYKQGWNDKENEIMDWIERWNGESDSFYGNLLSRKLEIILLKILSHLKIK